ncbi:alkaline phosphatase family protein, partial [Paludibacteraceae bacterium OttesenSCG-928-F17]|nr:alkaline phosphatase family protein [Paludibacteraceae bacterium OttesenSCG-928-F17]
KLGSNTTPDILMLQYTLRVPNEQYTAVKSLEKEDMYLRLDKDIKHLLETIKEEVGLKNTLVVLFSNKTGSHTPIELGDNKIPAGYFSANRSMALLNTYLMAVYGPEKWVEGYYGKNIILNRRKIEEKRINLNEMQQLVADFMLEFEGIRIAYTATQIQNLALSNDTEANNIRNSYHKNTGGDVVISLLPGWLEVGNNNISIGETSSFNSNVPFYMFGWNVKKQNIKTPYYITDIAPTISNILNIPYPNACIGTPIEEILK